MPGKRLTGWTLAGNGSYVHESGIVIHSLHQLQGLHHACWFIAYSPEIPGANGQGRTKEEAIQSLKEAIALILEDRREDELPGIPANAVRETVVLG